MRRSFRNVAVLVCALAIGTVAQLASGADPKVEAAAKKLQGDAMDVDFLSLDLKAAKKKLDDAIKQCGKDKCGPSLVASLQRDLGIVLINDKKTKDGQKAFEAAFAADASITIGKDFLANPEVNKAWEAAKKAAGGGSAPTATTPTTTASTSATTPAKPPTAPDAEGNLSVAAKIAPIGYQLPIVIEMPEGLDADVVKVSYKTAAMDKYKTLDAKKDAGKYVAIIDCTDTQFQGDIKFYVRAYDADKNEVDHYGTLKKPGIIKLVDKMPDGEEAPQLPGGKDPEKCVDKGDCQPGFPCDKSANKKPQGSGCDEDAECDAGLVCVLNEQGKKWCDEGKGGGGGGGKGGKEAKIYIGADIQQDFLLISGADNICKEQTWACTKNGQDIGVSDDKGTQVRDGGGGKTSGGPALATTRAFISFDYFIMPNLTLGARLGYAFNGNPTTNAKFLPYHLEVRLQYFLGKDPAAKVRPYLMAAGGLAEFDAKVPDIVAVPFDANKADDPVGCQNAPEEQKGAACRISGITAYRLAGQSFVGLGGGVWFMISPKIALNLGAKVLLPLPTFSPGFAPELGMKFGF